MAGSGRHSASEFQSMSLTRSDNLASSAADSARKDPYAASSQSSFSGGSTASRGYGHFDHLQRPVYNQHPPPAPSQSIIIVEGQNPRTRRTMKEWLFCATVITVCVVMFFVEMIVNNCPAQVRTSGKSCVLHFLGRLSFQPLDENPMFGPSFTALSNTGALQASKVVHGGEPWRLFTCMWLHAGVIHLVVNMMGVWYIGVPLESAFGPVRVGLVYLLSGFCGSLLSALFLQSSVSVGASGALFGLIGATLAELLINWNHYVNRIWALLSLLFIIGINIVLGLMPYVDNFAHMGGFIAGTLLGFSLLLKPQLEWEHLGGAAHTSAYLMAAQPGLPLPPKYTKAQRMTQIVAAVLFVVGFIVTLSVLFAGENGNSGCSWCHYLNCVPTSLWECPSNTTTTTCRAITNSSGGGQMVCSDGTSTAYSGTPSTSQLQALCTKLCA
eukprot:TRINITY_DN26886_c0_g1_i1.p1 TRINITY_DN26886_c0_g1~~TRINITY_DN26886_c0_g1_i1.p1  ORF type:complete len:440 (+),score=48.31 TRINITY_DN26886_c0_g1_i1:423-1742(+)